MWGLAIFGGLVVGGLVLLVAWSLLVAASRADAAMERILAEMEKQETTSEA